MPPEPSISPGWSELNNIYVDPEDSAKQSIWVFIDSNLDMDSCCPRLISYLGDFLVPFIRPTGGGGGWS